MVYPLTEKEYYGLKQSIKENGFWKSSPIIVNNKGVILDGHHRYRACQELGINCEFTTASFSDELLEKLFVINSNLQRRQLNSFQRAELALSKKPILDAIAKRNESLGGKGVRVQTPLGRVDEEIGRHAGVGKDTVRKVELILDKAPPELLAQARSGQRTINKIAGLIQKQEQLSALVRESEKLCKVRLPDNIQLIQANSRDLNVTDKITDNSIDLMFTDPPYDEKSLQVYRDLALLADRVLKDGGSLVTYAGHYALPQIFKIFDGCSRKLQYWHILNVTHEGRPARIYPRHVVVGWKPLLWFVKGKKLRTPDFLRDTIISSQPKKDLHKWQQSTAEAMHVIARLTLKSRNEIVLDPFMGSGTTGLAAMKLNRSFIGIEVNPETFEIAKANLSRSR